MFLDNLQQILLLILLPCENTVVLLNECYTAFCMVIDYLQLLQYPHSTLLVIISRPQVWVNVKKASWN